MLHIYYCLTCLILIRGCTHTHAVSYTHLDVYKRQVLGISRYGVASSWECTTLCSVSALDRIVSADVIAWKFLSALLFLFRNSLFRTLLKLSYNFEFITFNNYSVGVIYDMCCPRWTEIPNEGPANKTRKIKVNIIITNRSMLHLSRLFLLWFSLRPNP